ncbi:phenazine biosynthesis PhzC/PhzF family protein [Raphanus sativus]|nr:phenazine biosynthesis PhzC/PhzF family protein [Raphanus sativus]
MDICGHGTLASAHTLLSNGLVGSSETVEFFTHSGILTAKKVDDCETKGSFLIEMNFPVITTCEYSSNQSRAYGLPKCSHGTGSNDFSKFSKALNGATIVDVRGTTKDKLVFKPLKGATKSTSTDQIMVVLSSWEAVAELQPRTEDIMKCPGKVMIVTAPAPEGSAYDFCSRLFAPKLGLNEDSVCGSAHCALAHYWSLKLNKCDFIAYVASHRSGELKVHYDKAKQRVLLTGKAVTVMNGSVLV